MNIIGTVVLLGAALAAGPAVAQPVSQLTYDQVLSPSAVRAVQDRLQQMGSYSGAVDGIWGENSQVALQQFQQSHGLQVTGQLNDATATLLNLSPAELMLAGQTAGYVPPAQGRLLT